MVMEIITTQKGEKLSSGRGAISPLTARFFRESKRSRYTTVGGRWGYVKLRGGKWFNGRRKSNHFNMN